MIEIFKITVRAAKLLHSIPKLPIFKITTLRQHRPAEVVVSLEQEDDKSSIAGACPGLLLWVSLGWDTSGCPSLSSTPGQFLGIGTLSICILYERCFVQIEVGYEHWRPKTHDSVSPLKGLGKKQDPNTKLLSSQC